MDQEQDASERKEDNEADVDVAGAGEEGDDEEIETEDNQD